MPVGPAQSRRVTSQALAMQTGLLTPMNRRSNNILQTSKSNGAMAGARNYRPAASSCRATQIANSPSLLSGFPRSKGTFPRFCLHCTHFVRNKRRTHVFRTGSLVRLTAACLLRSTAGQRRCRTRRSMHGINSCDRAWYTAIGWRNRLSPTLHPIAEEGHAAALEGAILTFHSKVEVTMLNEKLASAKQRRRNRKRRIVSLWFDSCKKVSCFVFFTSTWCVSVT